VTAEGEGLPRMRKRRFVPRVKIIRADFAP